MQQLEMLYLLSQLHFKELFQEAEHEREWRMIRGERVNQQKFCQTVIDWFRSRISPQANRVQNPDVRESISNPFCIATKT